VHAHRPAHCGLNLCLSGRATSRKSSKPAVRYNFTDGFGYQLSVLFLVTVP
jgi:hypothetical protein